MVLVITFSNDHWSFFMSRSRAVKALAMVRTESTSSTGDSLLASIPNRKKVCPTAWKDHPQEVHKEVIEPKVEKLWPRINNLFVVEVKRVSCIVQNEAVDLPHGNNYL
jgi:hypothetical protein